MCLPRLVYTADTRRWASRPARAPGSPSQTGSRRRTPGWFSDWSVGAAPSLSRRSCSRVTHGVFVGDVTASGAVLWARTSEPATVWIRLESGPQARVVWTRTRAARDLTVHVALWFLRLSTTYRYRILLGGSRTAATRRTFRTAPRRDAAAPVRLAFGGDVGGQNVCRDARERRRPSTQRARPLRRCAAGAGRRAPALDEEGRQLRTERRGGKCAASLVVYPLSASTPRSIRPCRVCQTTLFGTKPFSKRRCAVSTWRCPPWSVNE